MCAICSYLDRAISAGCWHLYGGKVETAVFDELKMTIKMSRITGAEFTRTGFQCTGDEFLGSKPSPSPPRLMLNRRWKGRANYDGVVISMPTTYSSKKQRIMTRLSGTQSNGHDGVPKRDCGSYLTMMGGSLRRFP